MFFIALFFSYHMSDCKMSEKKEEPYECIEARLNDMFNEVNNDFTSIITYFEGVYKTFSKFEQKSQIIKSSLDSANVPDFFSSTVETVNDITKNAVNNLFFESNFDTGLEQLKNAHLNYTTAMKDKINIISIIFQKNRNCIQNLVRLNESKSDQTMCIQFHKNLLEFMQNYKSFYTNSEHIINQSITLSRDAIHEIENGVALTMSLLMGKFSLATDLEEVSMEPDSIIDLQRCVKDTLNFNYIYQNYIVQKSLLDSSDISYFALESVNRSNSKLKFSLKESTTGYQKDKPTDSNSSQVSLSQGQDGEIISFNGYSESWLANFHPQGQLYVLSSLLDVNLEK